MAQNWELIHPEEGATVTEYGDRLPSSKGDIEILNGANQMLTYWIKMVENMIPLNQQDVTPLEFRENSWMGVKSIRYAPFQVSTAPLPHLCSGGQAN